ncbi:arylesterase [Phenylobacterium sp.]|jgi:acyl-CoA thioesterase-1|uniref:arylesterase n=1 Tax=Phenylobacterium sp. TaxID=1871053 RepID=UPI002E2FF5AB|nr:arylesterase [Phenylobacterium sp.]HEX3365318.1 arylesterase [Phenylobacterium sp.]
MADTRPHFVSRRTLVAAGLAAVPGALPSWALAANGQVVTMLGDSITAGYGLPQAASLPIQLHLALQNLGVANLVRGAGVSGDTTQDGAARVDFSIRPDSQVVVVALGGNDLLQGVDPKTTHANLEHIVRRLKARHMAVILCGLHAPPELGAGYARDFDAVFPGVAKAERVTLYPDLLAGVARNPALNQGDAIHPNAKGVQIIAGRLAPVVAQALKKRA